MKLKNEFNWITDDPCYKCQYAFQLPESEIKSLFQRRFGCKCGKRLDRLVESARVCLSNGAKNSAAISMASENLQETVFLNSFYTDNKYYRCSEELPTPSCYLEDFEDVYVNAIARISEECLDEYNLITLHDKNIDFRFINSLCENVKKLTPFKQLSSKNAFDALKNIWTLCQSRLNDIFNEKQPLSQTCRFDAILADKIRQIVPENCRGVD